MVVRGRPGRNYSVGHVYTRGWSLYVAMVAYNSLLTVMSPSPNSRGFCFGACFLHDSACQPSYSRRFANHDHRSRSPCPRPFSLLQKHESRSRSPAVLEHEVDSRYADANLCVIFDTVRRRLMHFLDPFLNVLPQDLDGQRSLDHGFQC